HRFVVESQFCRQLCSEQPHSLGMAVSVWIFGIDGGGEGVEHSQEFLALLAKSKGVLMKQPKETRGRFNELKFITANVRIAALAIPSDQQADVRIIVHDPLDQQFGSGDGGQRIFSRRQYSSCFHRVNGEAFSAKSGEVAR